AATAGAVRGRTGRKPRRQATTVLSRASRGIRACRPNAGVDVGRRTVAAEAGGRVGAKPARAAPGRARASSTQAGEDVTRTGFSPERTIEMYVDAQEERMTTLSHRLDRSLVIQATPAIVFSFLTETPRWAAWWGTGSEIDARPGGHIRIVYPGGREATGEVLEVVAPERIVFTYGYADGQMIPPGG